MLRRRCHDSRLGKHGVRLECGNKTVSELERRWAPLYGRMSDSGGAFLYLLRLWRWGLGTLLLKIQPRVHVITICVYLTRTLYVRNLARVQGQNALQKLEKSGEASWWRLCYLRSLPRLVFISHAWVLEPGRSYYFLGHNLIATPMLAVLLNYLWALHGFWK